jgi:hypothetical protein
MGRKKGNIRELSVSSPEQREQEGAEGAGGSSNQVWESRRSLAREQSGGSLVTTRTTQITFRITVPVNWPPKRQVFDAVLRGLFTSLPTKRKI